MSVDLTATNNLNAYVHINPQDEAQKYRSEALKNKAIATISLIILGILIVGAVVVTSIFQPDIVPVVLLIGGSLSKPIYDKIFLKHAELWKQKSEYAEHADRMANKIKELQINAALTNNYLIKLHELGVNPFEIHHLDTLSALDAEDDPYRPLVNLMGRVHYWSETADKYQKQMQSFDKKIQEKAQQMVAPGVDQEKARQIKSAWLLLNTQKHKIEEEKYLPAKLAAAYNLHVITDIKDTRSFKEFGSPEPSSYLDSVTFENAKAQPFFYFKGVNRSPLSKAWLLDHSIHKIAEEIFGRDAIKVA